jgi:hypothetical protein
MGLGNTGSSGKLAIIGARVSTDTQAKLNYSLATQIEGMLAYSAREGFTIADDPANQWDKATLLRVFKVEEDKLDAVLQAVNGKAIYIDDISGKIPMRQRPGGRQIYRWIDGRQQTQQALDAKRSTIGPGCADVVLFFAVNRVTRDEDAIEILEIRRDVRRAGMQLHYALEGRADLSLDGAPVDFFRAWSAAKDNEQRSEATRRGLRGKAERGLVVGMGGAPYGYRFVDKRLAIHEPEARIVRQIHTWYAVGDETGRILSAWMIAKRLTEARVPTPSESNNNRRRKRPPFAWNTNTIGGILRNETYAGMWRFGRRQSGNRGEPLIEVTVPRIIARELWEKGRARAAENEANAPRRVHREYLLRGRVTCSKCGRRMRAVFNGSAGPRGASYYICSSRYDRPIRLDECRCGQPGVRTVHADAAAWEHVRSVLMDDDFEEKLRDAQRRELANVAPRQERTDEIAARMAELDQEAARVSSMVRRFEPGSRMAIQLEQEAAAIDREYAALERERGKLAATAARETISESRMAALQQLRREAAAGIANATFEDQQHVFEVLRVTAEVTGYHLTVICRFEIASGERLSALGNPTSKSHTGSHPST